MSYPPDVVFKIYKEIIPDEELKLNTLLVNVSELYCSTEQAKLSLQSWLCSFTNCVKFKFKFTVTLSEKVSGNFKSLTSNWATY